MRDFEFCKKTNTERAKNCAILAIENYCFDSNTDSFEDMLKHNTKFFVAKGLARHHLKYQLRKRNLLPKNPILYQERIVDYGQIYIV